MAPTMAIDVESDKLPFKAEPMNNIDYLATGYNIFKGDPHNVDRLDPGFTTNQIFKFTYNEAKETFDNRFKVPDHVDVKKESFCKVDYSSKSIKGETSLTDSFKQSVSVGLEGYGASFKASTTFTSMTEEINTHEKVYTSSQARCLAYNAGI